MAHILRQPVEPPPAPSLGRVLALADVIAEFAGRPPFARHHLPMKRYLLKLPLAPPA